MKKYRFGLCTHKGYVRDNNEDCLGVFPEKGLWIVADGVGGYGFGEVASSMSIDRIAWHVSNGETLVESLLEAHKDIRLRSETERDKYRMSCTVVAALFTDSSFEVAWVGDSRAYIWNQELLQLSRDHSLKQQLIDSGRINETEVSTMSLRHVITQALGFNNGKDPSVGVVSGCSSDIVHMLLCTDGLYEEVSVDEISTILSTDLTEQEKVDELISAALKAGGSDNITALLISPYN